jgi:hypothetical protein
MGTLTVTGEKHLRLQINGDYVSSAPLGGEVWACNLRQALVFGSVDDVGTFPTNWSVTPDFNSHVETDWTTTTTYGIDGPLSTTFDPTSYLTDYVMPTLAVWMPSTLHHGIARVTGASLYPCDTSGNAIGGNVAHGIFNTPVAGTGSGNCLPLENTVVLSWETHVLGPRGRGRIYGPVPPVGAMNGVGVLSDTYVTDAVASAKALIEGLSYSGTGGTTAHVRTVVTGPSSGGGISPYTRYGTIIGTKVGYVVDTQRRRRNKEPESYVEDSITQV